MRKDIPLHQYPKDVQTAARMTGLNYKRPCIRHGRRYCKPCRNCFCSALSGPGYETLRKMEKKGLRRERQALREEHLFLDDPRGAGLAGRKDPDPRPQRLNRGRRQSMATVKTIDAQTIGERLRTLRGSRTQKEVGDAIGVTAMAISFYERGERVPADDIKVALARYFNSTVEAIFFTF